MLALVHHPGRYHTPCRNQLPFSIKPEKVADVVKVLSVRAYAVSLPRVPELTFFQIEFNRLDCDISSRTFTVPSSSPVDSSHGMRFLTRFIVDLEQIRQDKSGTD